MLVAESFRTDPRRLACLWSSVVADFDGEKGFSEGMLRHAFGYRRVEGGLETWTTRRRYMDNRVGADTEARRRFGKK